MRRFLDCLFLAFTISLIFGCSRSAGQRTRPTPTPTPEVVLMGPRSALSTPGLVGQFPTLTPTAAPASASSPLQTPEAVLPPFPRGYTVDGSPITGTPIAAAPLVVCTPQPEFIECFDELLHMNFSYPAFMGSIGYTMLRQGGRSGYAYEYMFETRDTVAPWRSESVAGGRSHDFGEGRGPMYTDQEGFKGRPAADVCAGWLEAPLCQEVNPNIVHLVLFPQSRSFCTDSMLFSSPPRSIVILDLPQHPLINGFGFSAPLMSEEAEAAFQEEWYEGNKMCDLETQAEFDRQMEQMHLDLVAGSAAPDIQARYDAMNHLAQSVQSPFLAANP